MSPLLTYFIYDKYLLNVVLLPFILGGGGGGQTKIIKVIEEQGKKNSSLQMKVEISENRSNVIIKF